MAAAATTRQATTDEFGAFKVTEVPVGPLHLFVDGSPLTDGDYPTLSYNVVTVSGVDNPMPMPIFMVKLNPDTKVFAGNEDVAVTLPELPGFELSIPAGSVTFPDSKKEGFISVTAVNANTVPMTPPNGTQPQVIVNFSVEGF